MAHESRVAQRKATQRKYVFEESQVAAGLQSESEITAEQLFELSRQEAEAKGTIRASGLGASSVRALSRAAGFEFGQDKATAQKNFETARTEARTQLAVNLAERDAAFEAIGDTSGGQLALDLGIATVAAAAAGVGAGAAVAPAAAAPVTGAIPLSQGGAAINTAPTAIQPAASSGLVGFGGAPPPVLLV
jgi:hypothetical protein